MMKRIKPISAAVFSLIISSTFLFMADALATRAEFEAIKNLSETEKSTGGENIQRPQVEYKAGNFADPFQPSIAEDITGKGEGREMTGALSVSLTVQGVIWGGKFPQAIINNQVVKAGDTIEGARIISIKKEGVMVLFKDRQYNLSSPAGGTVAEEKPQGGKDEK